MSAGTSASHTDAWVRHNGRETRAQYRAQSPDGQYFLMKYSGERASSIRWFVLEDVSFVRPVETVITEPSAMVRNRLERTRATAQEVAGESRPSEADA